MGKKRKQPEGTLLEDQLKDLKTNVSKLLTNFSQNLAELDKIHKKTEFKSKAQDELLIKPSNCYDFKEETRTRTKTKTETGTKTKTETETETRTEKKIYIYTEYENCMIYLHSLKSNIEFVLTKEKDYRAKVNEILNLFSDWRKQQDSIIDTKNLAKEYKFKDNSLDLEKSIIDTLDDFQNLDMSLFKECCEIATLTTPTFQDLKIHSQTEENHISSNKMLHQKNLMMIVIRNFQTAHPIII